MKLLCFDDDRLGVRTDDEVVDISELVPASPAGRLAAWITATAAGRAPALLDLDTFPHLDPARLRP